MKMLEVTRRDGKTYLTGAAFQYTDRDGVTWIGAQVPLTCVRGYSIVAVENFCVQTQREEPKGAQP